jgi:hypothetical protein
LEKHRLFPRGDVFSAPQKFLTSGVDALKATGAALLGENNEGSKDILVIILARPTTKLMVLPLPSKLTWVTMLA